MDQKNLNKEKKDLGKGATRFYESRIKSSHRVLIKTHGKKPQCEADLEILTILALHREEMSMNGRKNDDTCMLSV